MLVTLERGLNTDLSTEKYGPTIADPEEISISAEGVVRLIHSEGLDLSTPGCRLEIPVV